MAFKEVYEDRIPSFIASSADLVNNKIDGITLVGAKVYITDQNNKCYIVKDDHTLQEYIETVSTKKFLSETQIGTDIDFTFTNNAVVNTNATPIDIAKPSNSIDEYSIIVYNPSTVTDLTIKVFSIVSNFAGGTKYSYITSFTVPKSAVISGTTINAYCFFLHGLFNKDNLRLIVSNNIALGANDTFTGTVRVREV